MTDRRTLVVVPAFQEEQALPGTLKELRDVVPDLDVLVVDDGSRDATAKVASAADVRVARLPFNLGVGAAVRTGLRYAVDQGYQRVVVVDADGQHDPATISSLLAAIDDGADMVIGSRFADPASTFSVGRTRTRAMRSLHRVVRWQTGQSFSDTTSGFRAFDAPVVAMLARDYPVEYLADTVEVLLMVCRAGYKVVEVPVAMRIRAGGQPSTRHLRLAYNYMRLMIGILASASRKAIPPPTDKS
ncbi:MAG TPA: glycosyltransferase family 2 protein [Acidimicrobiales bacterium]|nr:glycosyltransferase family 2 protein [Acidimicrobiales bacterium]